MRAERGQETPLTGRPTPAHTTGDPAGAQPNLLMGADDRTLAILEHRRQTGGMRRRGWLVRRALLLADVLGLAFAFLIAQAVATGEGDVAGALGRGTETLLFLATLPAWIVLAKLYGLYDRDEERTDHSTVDDLAGVFHLVTVGAWVFFIGSWLTSAAEPDLFKLALFWALAIALITVGRVAARAYCRGTVNYLQNAVIVGADDVGQLAARKLLRHPEYGINLVGFVDSSPRELHPDVSHLARARGSRPAARDRPHARRRAGRDRLLGRLERADARSRPLAEGRGRAGGHRAPALRARQLARRHPHDRGDAAREPAAASPLALVPVAQAHDGRGRLRARARAPLPPLPRARADDQAGHARPRVLPAAAHGRPRPDVHDPQVPDDGRRRRRAPSGRRPPERVREQPDAEGAKRPARHARRTASFAARRSTSSPSSGTCSRAR